MVGFIPFFNFWRRGCVSYNVWAYDPGQLEDSFGRIDQYSKLSDESSNSPDMRGHVIEGWMQT